MSDTFITIAEAARNLDDCVDRAHYQNQTFVLVKDGVPFARLLPASQAICLGSDLAKALAPSDLSDSEAKAWHDDLMAAREELKTPTDKWQ
jgi:hypothetical protein